MPRGIKSDTIIAGCALVAALCALGGSLYDGYQNRKNMRISQRSILRMDWSAKDGQVDIKIQNYGNGPAIVRWMAVFVDGKEAKNWDDVTKRYKPGASRYFGMLWPSGVIRNDAEVRTLYHSADPALVSSFTRDRYAVQVVVRSCSLYDECETVYLWDYKIPRPELPSERAQTFEVAPL